MYKNIHICILRNICMYTFILRNIYIVIASLYKNLMKHFLAILTLSIVVLMLTNTLVPKKAYELFSYIF